MPERKPNRRPRLRKKSRSAPRNNEADAPANGRKRFSVINRHKPTMPRVRQVSETGTMPGRNVACTHCGGPVQVGKRAMSVFCPHCKKRLILEDFRIKSYHASRLFATCGDIVVEKGGLVSAPIRVENLTVHGEVRGDVLARGLVTIATTGRIRGNITAPRLVMAGGAQLNGQLSIVPIPTDRSS